MARWIIQEDGSGWIVRKGRTSYGFPSQDEAERFAERNRAAGDTVMREEADGYRTLLRRRRHWRR